MASSPSYCCTYLYFSMKRKKSLLEILAKSKWIKGMEKSQPRMLPGPLPGSGGSTYAGVCLSTEMWISAEICSFAETSSLLPPRGISNPNCLFPTSIFPSNVSRPDLHFKNPSDNHKPKKLPTPLRGLVGETVFLVLPSACL